MPSGTHNTLIGIWGSGPNDVWISGFGSTLLRWNGANWNPWDSNTLEPLRKIWGSDPGNIWTVGFNTILRYRP